MINPSVSWNRLLHGLPRAVFTMLSHHYYIWSASGSFPSSGCYSVALIVIYCLSSLLYMPFPFVDYSSFRIHGFGFGFGFRLRPLVWSAERVRKARAICRNNHGAKLPGLIAEFKAEAVVSKRVISVTFRLLRFSVFQNKILILSRWVAKLYFTLPLRHCTPLDFHNTVFSLGVCTK